jgi:uncharacterized protein (UPF0335 family)
LTSKDVLEKDYQKFSLDLERLAEKEIKEIREKINAVMEEASKTGEAVELSLNDPPVKAKEKKS